jgi:glucose-6-phosphate 1-epimerase
MELGREERGAVTVTRVRTAGCEVDVTDHGAQVLRWRPTGGPDAVWISPRATYERGRPIRGGVPLCFPWFGLREGAPSHGFARLVRWLAEEPEADGEGVRFRWVLEPDADTTGWWPHPFRVEVTVYAGRELHHVVRVENAGGQALPCELALHGYLGVRDAAAAYVEGLDGAAVLDKVDGRSGVQGAGPLGFGAEVDAVFTPASRRVTLVDPGLGRRLHLDRDGAAHVVAWNPGPHKALGDLPDDGWRAFVCLETAAVAPTPLLLPPGGARVVTQRLSVEEQG